MCKTPVSGAVRRVRSFTWGHPLKRQSITSVIDECASTGSSQEDWLAKEFICSECFLEDERSEAAEETASTSTEMVDSMDSDEEEAEVESGGDVPLPVRTSAPKAKLAKRTTSSSSTAIVAAASAGTAELLTSTLFFPFELIKSRMQAAVRDNGNSYAYSGLADGLRTVVRQEGLGGLFAGLPQVAAQSVLNVFVSMFVGEYLQSPKRGAGGLLENALAFAMRFFGGAASALVALPLETVTARVMTSRTPLSAGAAARALLKEGGPAKFWSGLSFSLLLSLNPALNYTLVERLRGAILALKQKCVSGDQQPQQQQLTSLEAMIVGSVAKALTLCVVYPLIRGKVLMQARNTGRAGIFQVLRSIIAQEGIRSLYNGFGAQLSKSILSAAVKNAVSEHALRLLKH